MLSKKTISRAPEFRTVIMVTSFIRPCAVRAFTLSGAGARFLAGGRPPGICRRVRWRAPLLRPELTCCGQGRTFVATAVEEESQASSPMFDATKSFTDLGCTNASAAHLASAGLSIPTTVQVAVIPPLIHGLRRQVEYGQSVRQLKVESGLHLIGPSQGDEESTGGRPDSRGGSPLDGVEEEPPTLEPIVPPPANDVDDVLMVGAETGSGKTLAYLLPYMEVCREYPDFPTKAVIMVPSRELCSQVARQLQSYFPDAPAHLILAGGMPPDVSDVRTVRIVIATPAALLNYFRFSTQPDCNDKFIVVDEADMLLSGSFLRQVENVLNQPGMKPFATRRNAAERAVNRNRLVFVGATYPHWVGERVKSIVTWMNKRYPTIRTLQTDHIHKRSSRISESWHYLPAEDDRLKELVRILNEDCIETDKVMVFCGQVESVQNLHASLMERCGNSLVEKFGNVIQLHKNVPSTERSSGLSTFRDGDARLLLCTDMAARGLDLGAVKRVVEYEFSGNVVGYLHRIGRTARAGESGCTNHFFDDTSRPLADAIRERSQVNEVVVEGVFSRDRSFRRKLRKRQELQEG